MTSRVQAFGTFLDSVSMSEAIGLISDWIDGGETKCPYVVTPNLDHIVQLQSDKALQAAYDNASLVLVDGKPVYFSLCLLGKPVRETVSGSDLVPCLFHHWNVRKQRLKIFLLGGRPGVAEKAALNIAEKWPWIQSVGYDAPPLGFEQSACENKRIVQKINGADADLLVICLGAPKQEIWVHTHKSQLKVGAALCVGATIDFLADSQKRAPVWIRQLALEWLFRIFSDPKRLVRRYAKDALLFPSIFWREWRG